MTKLGNKASKTLPIFIQVGNLIGIEKCQPWVKNANLGQGYVQFVAKIFLKHTNKILNVLKILNKKTYKIY